jgi:hypothetical protein
VTVWAVVTLYCKKSQKSGNVAVAGQRVSEGVTEGWVVQAVLSVINYCWKTFLILGSIEVSNLDFGSASKTRDEFQLS